MTNPRSAQESRGPAAGPAPGVALLTDVLLVVLALCRRGLLWRAVQAAVRAAVPKAV